MEEVAEAHYIECAAQKVRRMAKTKEGKEAEKRRITEEKKKSLKCIQQLQDKVLVEDATLLESTGGSQIVGTKCRENTSGDKERQQPFKKAKRKQPGRYHRNTGVKMEGANPCERYIHTRQDCLVHNSR